MGFFKLSIRLPCWPGVAAGEHLPRSVRAVSIQWDSRHRAGLAAPPARSLRGQRGFTVLNIPEKRDPWAAAFRVCCGTDRPGQDADWAGLTWEKGMFLAAKTLLLKWTWQRDASLLAWWSQWDTAVGRPGLVPGPAVPPGRSFPSPGRTPMTHLAVICQLETNTCR